MRSKKPINFRLFFLILTEGFCKLRVTTNDENTKQFSNKIYLYIYAAGGTPINLGHHSWLSDACASGFSFIYPNKDNHK
jgi:hypothetical protein